MQATVLTDQQIERIHAASLTILETVGVVMPHPEMLSRFADCGAAVDREQSTVRIPPSLVEDCLCKAAKRITLYGRDVSRTAEFGGGKRNYNGIAGEAHWIEQPGQRRRFATLADAASAAGGVSLQPSPPWRPAQGPPRPPCGPAP